MKPLWSCEDGNFGLLFALLLVPIFGAAGIAVDYARATNVKELVQTQVDTAALNGAHTGSSGDISPQIAYLRSAILRDAGGRIEQLSVGGEWLSPTDLQVTAKGTIPLTILAAVPGFPDGIPFSTSATVRISEPKYVYSPPTVAQLDPDAADYDRIDVYCFDPDKRDNPGNHGRTQITKIADNAGSKFSYKMPSCKQGEALSFRLYNVRNARTNPKEWNSKYADRYEYYTDTVLKNGVEEYDGLKQDILETVMCDNLAECKGKSKGGILPEGAGRTPERTQEACAPGKYLYFGWEDRPPNSGSDRDYNDIRIVMSCPTVEAVGDRAVRLLN